MTRLDHPDWKESYPKVPIVMKS
ncbi:hypothetical protein CBM2634_B130003 [Cupriavidus taiwanensis]|uniref:Uncharacterized protein n=1 Tax=Cupriavidus taiwanensis TaxID=164546 RepID=A0A375J5P3_9BURK|nr:hypothetical protein CBM2634_B130003 [Cupriavidus taiwanensis]